MIQREVKNNKPIIIERNSLLLERCNQLLYKLNKLKMTSKRLEEIEGKDLKEKIETLRDILKETTKTEDERKKDEILKMICSQFSIRQSLQRKR